MPPKIKSEKCKIRLTFLNGSFNGSRNTNTQIKNTCKLAYKNNFLETASNTMCQTSHGV